MLGGSRMEGSSKRTSMRRERGGGIRSDPQLLHGLCIFYLFVQQVNMARDGTFLRLRQPEVQHFELMFALELGLGVSPFGAELILL